MRPWLVLIGFVAACLAAGAIGSLLTASGLREWYPTLIKPIWNPPSWVFGPVWTLLYILMGVSAWLVWRRGGWSRAHVVFGVQLLLNAAWSGLFFGLRSPGLAFAEIVALWLAIASTLVVFWRISAAAGALLVPYLGWVTFAAVLNGALWRLNP